MLIRHSVTVTTVTGGTATDYTPQLNGKLKRISYVKTDYAAGVDFAITGESTLQGLWAENNVDASKIVRPRIAVQGIVGTDVNYEGTNKIREPYVLVDERIKIEIAQGGDAKVGTFYFTIEQ